MVFQPWVFLSGCSYNLHQSHSWSVNLHIAWEAKPRANKAWKYWLLVVDVLLLWGLCLQRFYCVNQTVKAEIKTYWIVFVFKLIHQCLSVSAGTAGANTTGGLLGPNQSHPQWHQLNWHQPASRDMIPLNENCLQFHSPLLFLITGPNNIIDPTLPSKSPPPSPITTTEEEFGGTDLAWGAFCVH